MSHLLSPSEWVAPMVPILSLVVLPMGPLVFPRAYLCLLFAYFASFLYSQVNHLCKFYITSCRIQQTIKNWNSRLSHIEVPTEEHEGSSSSRAGSPNVTRERTTTSLLEIEEKLQYYHDPHYVHAFILPNYCEPEGLLRDTIERLANHRNAQSHYVIILAMEASENGYEAKGERLATWFGGRFLDFVVTGHPANIPGESRGKGSNVAYAARQGAATLLQNHPQLSMDRVILTVTDADAAIPELYVREMEDALDRVADPTKVLLAPPIFFSRNCFDVPAAVRVTDITWSAMVMSNLSNSRGLSFPCSTYSLSLALADRVGYWDTGADAVGEDMHMFLKCFFKTDGQACTVPIDVPINLTNVQTDGYFANINARYVQAKRHYNGVADVAYTLRNVYHATRMSALNKFLICLKVMEAHMIPVTSGWLMFAAVPLMQLLLFPPYQVIALVSPIDNPLLTSEFYANLWNIVKIITVFLPFPLFGTLAVYEQLHRSIDRDLLHKSKHDSRQWKNLLDYITLPIAAWLFMTLPSTLACMKRFRRREEQYIVAEKFFKEDIASKLDAII